MGILSWLGWASSPEDPKLRARASETRKACGASFLKDFEGFVE